MAAAAPTSELESRRSGTNIARARERERVLFVPFFNSSFSFEIFYLTFFDLVFRVLYY